MALIIQYIDPAVRGEGMTNWDEYGVKVAFQPIKNIQGTLDSSELPEGIWEENLQGFAVMANVVPNLLNGDLKP